MRQLYRLLFYLLGQIILAAGLTLSTKVHLGVSPILSIAYCASELTGCTIGDASLIVYIACIVAEVILHFRQEIDRSPVSFLFTRLMDLLSHHIPDYSGSLLYRIPLLFLAILFVGTGAAMTLDMRIIANPADGIVQVISDVSGLQLGLTKNIVDITCVAFTVAVSFIVARRIIGIHIGTVLAMLGTGRVIALFNKLMELPINWLMAHDN